MTKPKKEDLEKKVSAYSVTEGISETIDEKPWDYHARHLLGEMREGDKEFYSEAGPDAVKLAADTEIDRAKKELQETVFYSDLVSMYDGDKLKQLLSMLPPLKDGDYSELAKAHKEFYEAKEGWKTGLKLMKRDPEMYKRKVASEAKDEADRYFARGRDESTRKVAYGKVLEATRKLYQAIDKVKPKKKK